MYIYVIHVCIYIPVYTCVCVYLNVRNVCKWYKVVTYVHVYTHTEARGIKRIDITDPCALQIVNNTPPSDYLTNISAPYVQAISPPASGKREQRGPLCNCGGYVTWTSLRWWCDVCAAPAKVDGSIDAASTT